RRHTRFSRDWSSDVCSSDLRRRDCKEEEPRMTPHLISIYALVAMFVIATIWPINMGVLAFVGAFLVGTLLAAQTTKDIIGGFPEIGRASCRERREISSGAGA